MGSMSDDLENKINNHVLGGPDYARPSIVYVALYTVAPTDAGGGTEVSGGGYARAAVVNNATNWPASSSGSKSNGAAVTFPQATGSQGTVLAWAIFDAATGGNMMYWSTISPSVAISTSQIPQFAIGQLVITYD